MFREYLQDLRNEVLRLARSVLLDQRTNIAEGMIWVDMNNSTNRDRRLLMERHLISKNLAEASHKRAVAISGDEALSIMVNEEDHLRMQALRPGLQLKQAWQTIDSVDSKLEKKLDYAYSADLGYLTACPTNLGTGIRVSAMLHLPGLVLAEQINQIIQAVNKLGLAVRGLYGEGTEALGNVFQVSNQMTLGESGRMELDARDGVPVGPGDT